MSVSLRVRMLQMKVFLGCFAAVVAATPAMAGLLGSRHDFTSPSNPNASITPYGSCSACHLPHRAQPGARLWPRSLTLENSFYSLDFDPNYKPGTTLLCYDCHDDASAAHADADPDPAGWSGGVVGAHRPQDIALGALDGGPVGYYELVDGTFPTVGNAPRSTDLNVTTGGHYWKSAPTTGTPLYKRGDKIACELCHDPHNTATGANDVFFLKVTTNGSGVPVTLGDGLKASPNVRNHQIGGTGREMCAACHGYSDSSGAQLTLWGVSLPKPSLSTSQHLAANTTSCTDCHKHNRIVAGCNDCHTYPGLPNAGGLKHRLSAVHDVHTGVPSSEAAVPNKGYQCTVCHLGAVHNAGTGGAISGPAQWETLVAPNLNNRVQVRFDTTLNPAVTNPANPTQDSSSYDDINNVCSNLYCHGADATNFGAVSGTTTTPNWDLAATGDCGSCHDTGTNDVTSPGTSIGTGNHLVHLNASWGPVLGTDKDVACLACHPAYELSPAGPHANGTKSFLNLNNSTVTTLAATDTCSNCHGTSTASAKTPANWANGSYLLPCLECHDATTPANSLRSGLGASAPAKNANWTARGHGNATTYPWAPNRGGANLLCSDCHAATAAHINGSLGNTDRLTTAGNSLCGGCHASGAATKVSTHANTATGLTVDVELRFELNCVECHDVHGSANIFMIVPANPDGPLVAPRIYNNVDNDFTNYLYRGTVAFTDNSVGTSATSGVGYAQAGAGDASKICQTCHTLTGHYQYDSDNGHYTSNCMSCHPHDFDRIYTGTSQDGFMPKGTCEGCHNIVTPARKETGDWAPNVMGNGTNSAGAPTSSPPKPFDDGSWGFNVSGHGANGTAPTKFDIDLGAGTNWLNPNVPCDACHALQSHHYDGTLNSVTTGNRTVNTYHLKTDAPYPFVNESAPDGYTTQFTLDTACYSRCHTGIRSDMRHLGAANTPYGVSFFKVGYGAQVTNVLTLKWPLDSDISTRAAVGTTDYLPCVTCHNVHGANMTEPGSTSPRMMRTPWKGANSTSYCEICHLP